MVNLDTVQKVKMGPVTFVDASGAACGLATGVTFASSDSSILGITEVSDGIAYAVGLTPGTATVTVTTGAFSASVDFTVAASPATAITIAIGDVEAK
jgi:hypothetical protein